MTRIIFAEFHVIPGETYLMGGLWIDRINYGGYSNMFYWPHGDNDNFVFRWL
jgi:hypothetical protein